MLQGSSLATLAKAPAHDLAVALTPRLTKYIPHRPTDKQAAFLLLGGKEALYGGAAGGGKSDALLMAALQYVDHPGYSAIIFRRTYQDLSLPDALIPRSHEWLGGTDARWDSITHTWLFPSGAKLAFGYLDGPNDHFRYQGAAFQSVFWDELTQFAEEKYLYLFSRLRALTGSAIPLRVRSASNPGGIGHRWVKRRFIDRDTKDPAAVYIPARVKDNPHLRSDYKDSLGYLDDVTRARYLDGDWDVTDDNVSVYDFDRKRHVKTPPSDRPEEYVKRIAGVDPGTRDPYAVVILGLDDRHRWWALDEFYKTGGSTARWWGEFQALQNRWQTTRWWVDKRRPSDIRDLRSAGLPALANLEFHAETGRETIRPMIGIVQEILRTGRLYISPRCSWLIEEFEGYQYREAEDKNAGEVPVDASNHALDSLRYSLCSEEGSKYDGPSQLFRTGRRGEYTTKPPTKIHRVRMPTLGEALAAQDARMEREEEAARRADWRAFRQGANRREYGPPF